MPKLKLGTVRPNMEEDAAITEAAMQDPDAIPLTDEEWTTVERNLKHGPLGQEATKLQTNTCVDL